MAEAILRSKNIENMTVRSAGIQAFQGAPIAENARILIEEANMPYTKVSRALSKEDVMWADYIFTMTAGHKKVLIHLFPEHREKIYTLKGFVNSSIDEDVHDPFGGDLKTYAETFSELSTLMGELDQKLTKG